MTRRDCFGRASAHRNNLGWGARTLRSREGMHASLKKSSSRWAVQFLEPWLSHLAGDANERGRNLPARLHRSLEAGGGPGGGAGAIAVANRELEDAQSGARGPHLHLQIPAVGFLAHAEPVERIAPDRP